MALLHASEAALDARRRLVLAYALVLECLALVLEYAVPGRGWAEGGVVGFGGSDGDFFGESAFIDTLRVMSGLLLAPMPPPILPAPRHRAHVVPRQLVRCTALEMERRARQERCLCVHQAVLQGMTGANAYRVWVLVRTGCGVGVGAYRVLCRVLVHQASRTRPTPREKPASSQSASAPSSSSASR